MKTLKWNGEFWYEDRSPLWNRIAAWLLWIGGTRRSPAPVSLLGGRATYFGWGLQLRLPGGDRLVVSWCGKPPTEYFRSAPESVYISRDGTPARAHTWFVGAPREVREGARPAKRRWLFGGVQLTRPAGN